MIGKQSGSFIVRNVERALGWIFGTLLCLCTSAYAQDSEVKQLKALSIEDLMNIEITSVIKGPQQLSQAASAIQVITNDDIRRSGATSLPEALRLATNLQVAQVNSSSWIISARGFNTVYANKLLVLIDGRTVYTPLFGGVLWDLQHVVLEDIDRIEVISGPGGTLWGANAVNGVINIITKKAKETQGVFLSASASEIGKESVLDPWLKQSFEGRYGGKIGDKFFYRLYSQYQTRAQTYLPGSSKISKFRWSDRIWHLSDMQNLVHSKFREVYMGR